MKRILRAVVMLGLVLPAFAMKSNHSGWHGNAPVRHNPKLGAKSRGRL